ncbi:MAG: DUF4190 domain-containing protein [Nanoarchaeota archaeon]
MPAGIAAIVLGILGLRQIKRENKKGNALAIIGLVLGIVSIVLYVLLITVIFGGIFLRNTVSDSSIKYSGNIGDAETRITTKSIQIKVDANAQFLEQYKNKYGVYPKDLNEGTAKGYYLYRNDGYTDFEYSTTLDGKGYTLKSAGFDKEFNTIDDIIFEISD